MLSDAISTNSIYQYLISKETALYLATGLLGSRIVNDQSWILKGCILSSANLVSTKLGRQFFDPYPQTTVKVVAIISAAITSKLFASALGIPLESKRIAIIATFNLVSHLLYSYFFPRKGIIVNGELEFPKPHHFQSGFHTFAGLVYIIQSEEGKVYTSKALEDAYFHVHFPHENLVRKDGTFLQAPLEDIASQKYVIMEAIAYDAPETDVEIIVKTFIEKHHNLPKKLIMPYGVRNHTACFLIESHNEGCDITVIESLSSSSSYEWKKIIAGAKTALNKMLPGKTIRSTCNIWSQNNLMRCGTHVMLNVTHMSEYEGSIYDLIMQANETGNIPKAFAYRSEVELIQSFKKIETETNAYLDEVLKLNPNKIEF